MAVATHPVRLILPDGSEHALEVAEDEPILVAAHRCGLELPFMCLQGWCLTCAARVEGEGEWDQSESRRYYQSDRRAGFILLCTAKPRSPLTIRTHQAEQMRDFRMAHELPAPRAFKK